MNFPLISEYIEAIKSAEDNFEQLKDLRPVLGDDGLPVMTSGNFAVVFKMKDKQSGKFYALKCFTKDQEGRAEAYREIVKELKDVSSPYLVSIQYLEKELFVDTDQTTETEYPVLLMDWVEGKTLDKYLRENLADNYTLEMLAYRFSQLAQWLIPQPFAHGDLKPDNILVREDGTLVLVDYDGMYVPAMKGQKARELGSPDFRHPLRTENDFDEHIDDFSIVSILFSLIVISDNPTLLALYGSTDRLLLSENDYMNLSASNLIKVLIPNKQDIINSMAGILLLELYHYNMIDSLYRLVVIPEPSKLSDEELSTEIKTTNLDTFLHATATIDEIKNGILDQNGVLYSADGLKLLNAYSYQGGDVYTVKDGTKILCSNAYTDSETGKFPSLLILPQSIISIGKDAFESIYSPNVSELLVPNGQSERFKAMTSQYQHIIYDYALSTICTDKDLNDGVIDEFGVVYSRDGNRLLKCLNRGDIMEYEVRKGTKVICDGAFCGELSGEHEWKSNLKSVLLPDSILRIGGSFNACECLKDIEIPQSVISLNGFWLSGIEKITIPASVTIIEDFTFGPTCHLKEITLKGKPLISPNSFVEVPGLETIYIPKGSRDYFTKQMPKFSNLFVEL